MLSANCLHFVVRRRADFREGQGYKCCRVLSFKWGKKMRRAYELVLSASQECLALISRSYTERQEGTNIFLLFCYLVLVAATQPSFHERWLFIGKRFRDGSY